MTQDKKVLGLRKKQACYSCPIAWEEAEIQYPCTSVMAGIAHMCQEKALAGTAGLLVQLCYITSTATVNSHKVAPTGLFSFSLHSPTIRPSQHLTSKLIPLSRVHSSGALLLRSGELYKFMAVEDFLILYRIRRKRKYLLLNQCLSGKNK